MATEIIEINDKVNGTMFVEQLDNNCINFQTGTKRKSVEVNFYVFDEIEIEKMLKKQEELYKMMDDNIEGRLWIINKFKSIMKK